jgi:uncharacterized protein (TIGR02996 family)
MTTEDDFQRALDEHPKDWQTRLVFADWLQDRDDPRAAGYRAMGELRAAMSRYVPDWYTRADLHEPYAWLVWPRRSHVLHAQWFDRIDSPLRSNHFFPDYKNTATLYVSRAEVDDSVALAFSAIPEAARDLMVSEMRAALHAFWNSVQSQPDRETM